MLIAKELKRVFIMKDKGGEVILADPEPKWSAMAVLNFFSNTYPLLTTATVSAPRIKDDTVQFTFDSIMGTKG